MDLPTSPPLYALVNAHLLLAGPVLGLVGAGMLRLRGRAKGWRPVAWLAGAKALSTWMVLFPASVAFAGLVPSMLGLDPLGRLPWLALAFGVLLLVASSLLEWPFFFHALAHRDGSTALGLAFQANAACLVLLVALYLPFCELTLLGARAGGLPRSQGGACLQVFYLRDGALFRRGLEGPETPVAAGLTFGDEARLFARRGEDGWDLWSQERNRTPQLMRVAVAPGAARAPQQALLHIKLKQAIRTVEPALPETWGGPAEWELEGDSAWSVQLGQWPREGLRAESRDLRGGFGLALDTPLLSWDARCATRLPGERLLFQMGPYLWLLDLETKTVRLFTKGQGAQVFGP